MTPIVLTQPEPLEMILLLQCHQMLPQLVNLHALLHLLLSKSYQRCRIYIQLNLVRERGALNLNAPTVLLHCRCLSGHLLCRVANRY